jgi:hypothetical protein
MMTACLVWNLMKYQGLDYFSPFNTRWKFPGVSIANFIRAALNARLKEGEKIKAVEYYKNCMPTWMTWVWTENLLPVH